MLGKEVDGFVACDKFQPTVLEGQICYSLDLGKAGNGKSKAGKNNGLQLVLDSNIPGNEDINVASIYLDTLSPFTYYRNGSYAMSSLKKMTGTKGFLGMHDADKKCQVETFDECNTRKYFEKVRSECLCTLWALDNRGVVGISHFQTCPRISPSAPRPPHPALIQFQKPVMIARSPALDSMLMSHSLWKTILT